MADKYNPGAGTKTDVGWASDAPKASIPVGGPNVESPVNYANCQPINPTEVYDYEEMPVFRPMGQNDIEDNKGWSGKTGRAKKRAPEYY